MLPLYAFRYWAASPLPLPSTPQRFISYTCHLLTIFLSIHYAARYDSCGSYIYDLFSHCSFLCDSFYLFSYAKHKHTYIFFISIILILRLYSNNVFKASTAILSDAMISSIAMMLPVYVIWYYVCNMMKKVGRKVTNKMENIRKNGRNE